MSTELKFLVRRALQGVVAVVAVGALGVLFMLFLRVEQHALKRNERPIRPGLATGNKQASQNLSDTQSDSLYELFGAKFTVDERTLAEVFSADTLPRMLELGLIKELRRGDVNALLIVDGRLWRARKRETKHQLLVQLRAYNKVHALPTPVQVRDASTKQLLAEISPTAVLSIYL